MCLATGIEIAITSASTTRISPSARCARMKTVAPASIFDQISSAVAGSDAPAQNIDIKIWQCFVAPWFRCTLGSRRQRRWNTLCNRGSKSCLSCDPVRQSRGSGSAA
jgi:hypothetical protein